MENSSMERRKRGQLGLQGGKEERRNMKEKRRIPPLNQ